MLLEQERMQNDQLQAEIQRLRQQFEMSMRDKDRIYQARERVIQFFFSHPAKINFLEVILSEEVDSIHLPHFKFCWLSFNCFEI